MIETVLPIIARGRTERSAALPEQEFRERVAALQESMHSRGLRWLLCAGDRAEYGPVCYVSGVVPRDRWNATLTPLSGEPELYVGVVSERDLPAMRGLTWIEDVRGLGTLAERVRGLEGPVGLAAPARLAASVLRSLRAAGAQAPALELVEQVLARPRPRERALLRDCATIALEAAAVVERSHASGASPLDALIDGELSARRAGAHDVRMLAGGLELGPREELPAALARFSFYLAVELDGYWSELLRSPGGARDEVSLRAAAQAFAAGAPVTHDVVALGLSLREARGTAARDGLYSLRDAQHSLLFELTGGDLSVLG